MRPWLTIIGIGEDGLDGLSIAGRSALAKAAVVFGGPRHLSLAEVGARGRPWSVPFSIEPVLACRGEPTAVLASGDPFWFGVGGTLARHLSPEEWTAYPMASTFSLVAMRLGWRLEETACLGLHAASFEQLTPHLRNGGQAICLVRDGEAVRALCAWLSARGCDETTVWAFEAVAGPREQVRSFAADRAGELQFNTPVTVALHIRRKQRQSRASGLPDDAFQHDGQITKRPVRAITLSALQPCVGETLWDLGAGSGSIAIEWLLAAGPTGRAVAVEPRADRACNIRMNAETHGVSSQLTVVEGRAPTALAALASPDAVFVGGGATSSVLEEIWRCVAPGTRVVVNAVTLETEALLAFWSERHGGDLLRIELAPAAALGSRRGWAPARPVVQWSVVR